MKEDNHPPITLITADEQDLAQSQNPQDLRMGLSFLGLGFLEPTEISPEILVDLSIPSPSSTSSSPDKCYDADGESSCSFYLSDLNSPSPFVAPSRSDTASSFRSSRPKTARPKLGFPTHSSSSDTCSTLSNVSLAAAVAIRQLPTGNDSDPSDVRDTQVESSSLDSPWSMDRTPESDQNMEANRTEAPPEFEEEIDEIGDNFKQALTNLLHQMMFVSGETAEPSIETTTLIEEITRQQVIEIVRKFPIIPTYPQPVACLLINVTAHTQYCFGYSPGFKVYLNR